MLQQSSASPAATTGPFAAAPAPAPATASMARVGSDVDRQHSSAQDAGGSIPPANGAAASSTTPSPEGLERGGVAGLRVGASEDGGGPKQQQLSKEELLQEVCQRWCTLWWPGLFLKVSR